MSILKLPSEILKEVFMDFQSFAEYLSLASCCKHFRKILKDLLLVIDGERCGHQLKSGANDFQPLAFLDHLDIRQVSIREIELSMNKYHYFIFNMTSTNPASYYYSTTQSNSLKIMKIVMKTLQSHGKFHTVIINSKSFAVNPLMKSLIPKLNSSYTEFFFPYIKFIEGFDDLRLLDNTRCYFNQLKRLTIGSFSFQLFSLQAPKLKILNQSELLIEKALNDNVDSTKISYADFLNEMSCSQLEVIELIGNKIPEHIICKFRHLKILKIYSDNLSTEFNLGGLQNLKELTISKCCNLKKIKNFESVCRTLEILDLSNNGKFDQHIVGNFESLSRLNLSNTNISEIPMVHVSGRQCYLITDGCHNLRA